MRSSDWISDVCSSDLSQDRRDRLGQDQHHVHALLRLLYPADRHHGGGLPAGRGAGAELRDRRRHEESQERPRRRLGAYGPVGGIVELGGARQGPDRSEEHTSELQSLMRISYAVFCLNTKTKVQDYTL